VNPHDAAHLWPTMTAEPLSDEALLARLVAFDTTSHKSNREIADFLTAYRTSISRLQSVFSRISATRRYLPASGVSSKS